MNKLFFWVAPVTWILYGLLIDLPMYLAGHVVCRRLARKRAFDVFRSTRWPERRLLQWTPLWAYPWGNEEDGIDGLRGGDPSNYWWAERTQDLTDVERIIAWAANRNAASNMRFILPFGFLIDPKRVDWVGNSADPRSEGPKHPERYLWCIARQGIYSGFIFSYRGVRGRIGWAVEPTDSIGISPDDYRSRGCGFKAQLQRD